MTQPEELDEDKLELIERRLSEKIAANVESRVLKYYLAMGAGAIAVLTLIGWSIIDSATDAMTDRIEQKYLLRVEEKITDAAVRISTTDALLERAAAAYDKVDELTAQASDSVTRIGKLAESAEPKLVQIETFTDRVDDLVAQTMDLQGKLASGETAASQIDELVRKLPGLAEQVAKLAELVAKLTPATTAPVDPAEPTAQQVAQSTGQISVSAAEAIQTIDVAKEQPVAFVQYFGMPKETAAKIADGVAGAGFLVPGIENVRMPSAGLSEVRFYYEADRVQATDLVNTANRVLQDLGLAAKPVVLNPLVNWPKRKPKQGTLELWIGLPATASAG